jgi:hypothetical protein
MFHFNRRTQTEGISELGDDENIWTKEELNNSIMEKFA